MSNAVQADVQLLVQKELNSANEKFPPFNSAHEGYAVIKEEIEESSECLQDIKQWHNEIWDLIKFNQGTEIQGEAARKLKLHAVNLACEAIQVAAMAQKFLDMGGD